MATTTPAGVRASAEHGGGTSGGVQMTHRQILEALSGLMLGMFVAMISSTIVGNAMPRIIADLGGGQSAYTWVVTSSLLAMTASTPLWGKLADLYNKKLLIQIALVLFVVASAGAGFSQNPETLIAFRVFQGIGGGGLAALSQVILASIISPRERGKYAGYLGAVFAVATVGGPLLGGVITDTESLGWRWCFYVGIPFAVVALIVLQKTLHVPTVRRKVKVDWLGATLVAAATCLILLWVTFAGDKYEWISWQTYAMVGGSVALTLLFLLVESKASEPIIPLRLFRNRTVTLSALASLFVGIGMFAGTIFFAQYFQLARGESPTMSGVLTIPMIGGLFVSSTVSGNLITRTGRWKGWLVAGGFLLAAGLGLLGTIRHDTPYWHVAVFMAVMGVGVGMMMQNLLLAAQNQVAPGDLGAASSVANFFRSLGGAVGVSAFGAVLANRVTDYVKDGLADLPPKYAAAMGSGDASDSIPDVSALPAPLREVMESAYGHGIADIFLISAPIALLAFFLTLFIKEVPLKTHSAMEEASAAVAPGQAEVTGTAPTGPKHAAPSAAAVAATTAGAVAATAAPERTGLPVHGFVRDADSAPLPHAAVTLISLEGRQLGRAVAQADGAYAVDAPGVGSYVLIASADGFQPQASTVTVNGEPLSYDILLSGTSGLTGVVRSAATGEPVPDAMVIVTDVRGDLIATGATDAHGEFAFGAVVPGDVTVAVNAAGHRPSALPVRVATTGVTRVEAALDAGSRLKGVVRSPHGPLADARVTLLDAAGNVVSTATTGEDGAYAFADLDGGDYTVIATGYPPVATTLTVRQDVEDHTVELAHPGE
ncbi:MULTISPECIES: MFS transporter [Streptomyces]|uniref:MFS transporter n=1 Tax=Streptomyces TaxID=1883 RepID=UPI0019D265EA|nr:MULTISPECIES: MFS transporter [Streptomyces]MDH6226146.1 EmrB/QacA subfamily drug resistance transporter [Streptomyces sp. MJP52]